MWTEILNWILKHFSANPALYERSSPKIRIKTGDVSLDMATNEVHFKGLKPGTWVTSVADTGSMDPLIDIGMMVILEPIRDIHDLIVGDIICYQKPGTPCLILHRIIKIYEDSTGWWCQAKGDNSVSKDPGWIETSWVRYILRGILH